MATGVLAQPDPNNMFIDGYVLDSAGQAVVNHQVCVFWQNDSLCTTTNANGYYFLNIVNGSATGPNVTYTIQTNDTCAWLLLQQTRDNVQGMIDTAIVNFTLCAQGMCNGLQAGFTTSIDSSNGLAYTFTPNVTGGTPGYTYQWLGVFNGQIGSIVTYQPALGEMFDVCLAVTDANGCSSIVCDTVNVDGNQGGCQAGFTYPSNPSGALEAGSSVQLFFDGVSGNNSTYSWTLSAGGATFTATGMNPVFQIPPTLLPVSGIIVQICVTVSDAGTGCTDSYCDNVLVVPANTTGCQAYYTWAPDNMLGNPLPAVQFADNSYNAASYYWDFGDNTFSTSQNPIHAYNGTGTYIVCLTIVSADSLCQDTYCDTVYVGNNNGNCSATVEVNGILTGGSTVMLTAIESGIAPFSFLWDNGSTDSSIVVLDPGTYCVTVTDAIGCLSTACGVVLSDNGNCDASFTNSGPTPIGYTFSANVQNPNTSYQWRIDGQIVGSGYDAYSPGFTNGAHTICLTIIDSLNNCYDQQCQTINVTGSNICDGYIRGYVYAGSNNQPLDEGVVYLILHDSITNTLTVVDSMIIDTSNFYMFGLLDCGDYLIKAAAYSGSQYYSNHIPTYYGNSPFWGFAQTVTLGQVNTQVNADVTLIAANNPGGPGFIGGDVTQGANKTDEGDPLAGMQVMLFNLSGQAIAYTYTDASGAFGFSDLAYGSYQVYVEALGVQTIPALVTIGSETPSVEDVHILASETLISTAIEEFDFEGAISEVYPNPVLHDATIKFNLESATKLNLSILDLRGRQITTQMVAVAGGENLISVKAENLIGGYYFLNIQDVDGNFSVTRKFMRVD